MSKIEQQRSLKTVKEEKVEKQREINEVVIRMDVYESSSKRNDQ